MAGVLIMELKLVYKYLFYLLLSFSEQTLPLLLWKFFKILYLISVITICEEKWINLNNW